MLNRFSLLFRMRSPPQTFQVLRQASSGPAAAQHHGSCVPFPPGPRQYEQAKNWYTSAFTYGAAGFGLLCYLTDWRVVCSYIPFYNGKYIEGDARDKAEAEEKEKERLKKELCKCEDEE